MCSDCEGGVACGDDLDELAAHLRERDELLAHLVDDGVISAEDAEWTECDECSVVYPRHELVKCPGCGLLLCENCTPHGYSCENYSL